MTKQLKVLFTPLTSFISHVTRCLCIAEVLKKRGYQVEFLAGGKYNDMIKKAGFTTHAVHQMSHNDIVFAGSPEEYRSRFISDNNRNESRKKLGIKQMLIDDITVMNRFKPDIVVCDSRPTSFIASLSLRIPTMMIKNILGYVDGNILPKLKERGIDFETEIDYSMESDLTEEFVGDCSKLSKVLGLSDKEIHYIIPGFPEFEIVDGVNIFEGLPHRFVGYFSWNGWKNMQKPDKQKYAGKTVILVTLGSSFPFRKLVKTILNALNDPRYHIIVNTGGQFDPAEINNDQHNYEILPYISLLDYLEITDVLIFHGGHGTQMNAFEKAVPGVVIPFNGDQIEISRQVEKLKCGIRIKKYPDDITETEIKDAVTEILTNPVYRETVARFQTYLFRMKNGAEQAADYVEECVKKEIRKEMLDKSRLFFRDESLKKENNGRNSYRILIAPLSTHRPSLENAVHIARALGNMGHETAFITHSSVCERVEKAGFRAFAADDLPVGRISRVGQPEEYRIRQGKSSGTAEQVEKMDLIKMAEQDLNIIESFDPHLILLGGRLSTYVSARVLRKPAIRLFSFIDFLNLDRIWTDSDAADTSDVKYELRNALTALCRKYSFDPGKFRVESFMGNGHIRLPVLVPLIPHCLPITEGTISPTEEPFFAGFLPWKKEKAENRFLIDPQYMERKVIFLYFENSTPYKSFIARVSETFSAQDWKIVVKVNDPASPSFPEISHCEWLSPDSPVLDRLRLADIVIHCGSIETMMNVLNARVPGIIIPVNWEEFQVADFIERNRFGSVIRKYPADISADELTEMVNDVIETKLITQKLTLLPREFSLWKQGAELLTQKITELADEVNSSPVVDNKVYNR